jgi:hypothetical protein
MNKFINSIFFQKNEVVWFVVMLTTFPMTQEIIAPEPLVRRYQNIRKFY